MVMNNVILYVEVDDQRWEESLPNVEVLCNEILQEVFAVIKKQIKNKVIKQASSLSINLMLSNDRTIHKLNLDFRGKNMPTNVLSFANIDSPDFEFDSENGETVELGDVIIALETLQHEAEIKNISLKNHFSHLWLHGILHLLGYDHIDDEEAEEMENLEILLLQNLGINNPYVDMDNAQD